MAPDGHERSETNSLARHRVLLGCDNRTSYIDDYGWKSVCHDHQDASIEVSVQSCFVEGSSISEATQTLSDDSGGMLESSARPSHETYEWEGETPWRGLIYLAVEASPN